MRSEIKALKIRGEAMAKSLKAGDKVRLRMDNGTTIETELTDDPWLLGGHSWVVKCKGVSSCYCITHCERI